MTAKTFDLNQSAMTLVKSQKKEWPLVLQNYANLRHVKTRAFEFDGFTIFVQFNPARIISSSASVEKEAIKKRPCFLCTSNRPPEQKAISVDPCYLILVNPFPIFPCHLTITHETHVDQAILPRFADMLSLAKSLSGFTVFYNGPRCGASAPDHFHFQAGSKGFMPLDRETHLLKKRYGEALTPDGSSLFRVDDGIRRFFLMESTSEIFLESAFRKIYKQLQLKMKTGHDEPEMNIHAAFEGDTHRVLLFPRGAHRPWQYFETGEKNILFSPASVDLGGVLTMPLEKDFSKIRSSDIMDMLHQAGISREIFLSVQLSGM